MEEIKLEEQFNLACGETVIKHFLSEILVKDIESREFTIKCGIMVAFTIASIIKALNNSTDIFKFDFVIDEDYGLEAYSLDNGKYIVYGNNE